MVLTLERQLTDMTHLLNQTREEVTNLQNTVETLQQERDAWKDKATDA
jgi:t-SNARE complex subunit (syntaxin)